MRALLAVLLCCWVGPAGAQEILRYGYSGGADSVAAWVAQEQGFFKARGLAVEMTQTTNSALFPAALQSGSLDVAAPTAPLVLQADAGGLDLVIISGGSVVVPATSGMVALARPDFAVRGAADFVGRKVAVPGLGGFLDILFREWLRRGGVAPGRVAYVELGQGVMADALRSGSADAVIVSDPVATRIEQIHAGTVAGVITEGLPAGLPIIVYAARRGWAEAHRQAAHGFADAIAQATGYALAHPDETRALISRYLKINADLASLPALQSKITPDDLSLWLPILQSQDLVPNGFGVARIIL